MEKLTLPVRAIPVKGDYDVVVAGGGTAGAFAGISAAREGLKTLVVEQFGTLGGSSTMALVTPVMSSHMGNYRGHCPLGEELSALLRKLGGTENDDYYFDPTVMKAALEQMLIDSGCELLYYTTLADAVKSEDGKRITHLVINNKDGLQAISARYFVDCTGDADLSAMAGVPFESGDHNRVNQPVSLRFEMAGIDYDRFHVYMKEIGYDGTKYFAMNTGGMKEVLQKAHEDGILTKQDIVYFQGFGIPGKPDAMAFNCPELTTKENVVDAEFLTQKQLEGKQAILRLRRFLRERIPGFEKAYITEIAPMVGVRESRRIEAEYILTIQDLLGYHKFEDAVIKNKYPVDVHGVDDVTLGLSYDTTLPKEEQYWEVPFSCMIAKGVDNLLAAGRCAGMDFRAQSAARVQLICRAMGEAAGIGCSLAKRENRPFRELDGHEIKKRML